MVAVIASENNQYLQDWFNTHYMTIEISISMTFFAITHVCELKIICAKQMFAFNNIN
jgi:hypothetical protein